MHRQPEYIYNSTFCFGKNREEALHNCKGVFEDEAIMKITMIIMMMMATMPLFHPWNCCKLRLLHNRRRHTCTEWRVKTLNIVIIPLEVSDCLTSLTMVVMMAHKPLTMTTIIKIIIRSMRCAAASLQFERASFPSQYNRRVTAS